MVAHLPSRRHRRRRLMGTPSSPSEACFGSHQAYGADDPSVPIIPGRDPGSGHPSARRLRPRPLRFYYLYSWHHHGALAGVRRRRGTALLWAENCARRLDCVATLPQILHRTACFGNAYLGIDFYCRRCSERWREIKAVGNTKLRESTATVGLGLHDCVQNRPIPPSSVAASSKLAGVDENRNVPIGESPRHCDGRTGGICSLSAFLYALPVDQLKPPAHRRNGNCCESQLISAATEHEEAHCPPTPPLCHWSSCC